MSEPDSLSTPRTYPTSPSIIHPAGFMAAHFRVYSSLCFNEACKSKRTRGAKVIGVLRLKREQLNGAPLSATRWRRWCDRILGEATVRDMKCRNVVRCVVVQFT